MKKLMILAALLATLYLGTYNGSLALWQNGNEEPLRIYPYSAEVYTKIDQYFLKKGIRITDFDVIEKHLEDFLS